MARYVFSFATAAIGAVPLASARRTANSHGATVLRAIAGTMLLEAPPATAAAVAKALPGWRYTPERKTSRVPERTQLQRARQLAKAP
ncbi:hypothetical protein [Roseateles sp. BYS87W]|uniref:Secreted protein n=1 Tax=Pelomonas baiyunensis TaxID=3299026 RepID=A0ABW7GSS4_9BURK